MNDSFNINGSFSIKYPCIVAEKDGKVLAWGSLTQYSQRKAYDGTCEISIYVDENTRGLGLGKVIIKELIERASKNNIHVILSRVAGENEASKNPEHWINDGLRQYFEERKQKLENLKTPKDK